MNSRIALVIGVKEFEDHELDDLPGVGVDLERIGKFANDERRGAYDDVVVLESPGKREAHLAISALFKRASENNQLAMLYIATHGLTEGPVGLRLCMRDTQVRAASATTLSLAEIAQTIGEHRPQRTIIVIDACEAGGHVAAAGELAQGKLWSDLTSAASSDPEGHFMIVACGTIESAREDGLGGKFTQALLRSMEEAGKSNTANSWIPTERVASEVVKRPPSADQRPEWSGIAISIDVNFSRNPHYDEDAAAIAASVDASVFVADERDLLRPHLLAFNSSFAQIGSGRPWSAAAIQSAASVADLAISDDAKGVFWLQAVMGAADRVKDRGTAEQQFEFVRFAQSTICLISSLGKKGEDALEIVARIVAEIVPELLVAAEEWWSKHGWFNESDGPATFGLSCIRFWDVLSTMAFAVLCCDEGPKDNDARKLADAIARYISQKPEFHRVDWAGQYPDLACALSMTLAVDATTGRAAIGNVLTHLLSRSFSPAPSSMPPRELGKELAAQAFGQTDVATEHADEGLAMCVSLIALGGASAVELEATVARVLTGNLAQRVFLYRAASVGQLHQPIMVSKAPLDWGRTAESMVEFCDVLKGGISVLEDNSSRRGQMLTCLAAAAVYRNRAGIDAVAVIPEVWALESGVPDDN